MSKRCMWTIGTVAAWLVGSAACAPQASDVDSDLFPTASEDQDLRLRDVRVVGWMASGETRWSVYSAPPALRAFGFEAKGGDLIQVDVTSSLGDAEAWITDDKLNALAYNDDASSSTLDAKVLYTVPAGQPARRYRAVFREYDSMPATFQVKLTITAPMPCSYAGQSVAYGASVASIDGCNTCTCGTGGVVSCTKNICQCNPALEPLRTYVGTPDQCVKIRYSCATDKRSFSNACGCGCEPIP